VTSRRLLIGAFVILALGGISIQSSAQPISTETLGCPLIGPYGNEIWDICDDGTMIAEECMNRCSCVGTGAHCDDNQVCGPMGCEYYIQCHCEAS
jgi:hypothetical protein